MRISDLHPTKAAGCMIHAKDTNRWLFLLRSSDVDHPLTWGLPGGQIELDEDFLTGALRETAEEIGHDLTGKPHSLIYSIRSDWPLSVFKTYAICVENQFEPILNWESQDQRWCELSELPTPLHWGIEAMLNSDEAGERLHKWLASLG